MTRITVRDLDFKSLLNDLNNNEIVDISGGHHCNRYTDFWYKLGCGLGGFVRNFNPPG